MCPTATRELAAKLPTSFHAHHATSPEGGSATKRGVGTESGPPASSALMPSPPSAGPGWGPSAPRSPLRRSRSLDHCINLLQKHPAPCPDHRPAQLSPSYHKPPFFALCPHPLSLPDCWEGMRSLPAPQEPSPQVRLGKLKSPVRGSEFMCSSRSWWAQLSPFTWFGYYSCSLIVEKITLKIKM